MEFFLGGLAAAAGQIIGTSLSPELWLGVIFAVARGSSFGRTIAWASAAAVAVVALRIALIGINSGTQRMVLATFAATLLWAATGFLIRRGVVRLLRARA